MRLRAESLVHPYANAVTRLMPKLMFIVPKT